MAKRSNPRHGSMQFWPRKRAARIYPRTRSWPKVDGTRLIGFAGYKAGMTQIQLRDNTGSTTKGQVITIPVTIIECPPLKPLSLRFYQKTLDGLKLISEIPTPMQIDKELSRKLTLSKKKSEKTMPEKFDRATLQVYTQPKLTSLKKKPEVFEIEISNASQSDLKSFLEKEIKISDTFKPGQFVDISAVTKGKGFQGPVKRFGVNLRQKKSEKVKRGPASLGPWRGQQHTMFRIAHAGQMGFHTRTEYNKLLLKISSDIESINPSSGLQNYGLIKSDFILLKGSIGGVRKRLIRIREPIRSKSKSIVPELIQ